MLFRCLNPKCSDVLDKIGHDFAADLPVCPKCGLDARNPKYRRFMELVTVIHFDPPENIVPGVGVNLSLCNGKTPAELGAVRPMEQLTGDPEAVTCPVCKAHSEFPKDFNAALAVPKWIGVHADPGCQGCK